MRALIQWAAVLSVAVFVDQAQATINILKANGQPVPSGAATKTFNAATGGWDITLSQLYAPWSDTVYDIHGDAAEVIDNVFIQVNGPAAGSPLIVRVLGDAPGYVRTVHNIVQLGTAETLLNNVNVTEDIGSVQVQAIGYLTAGHDILGPIVATTPDNSVRGVTRAQAGRHILGDITAEHGRILLVYAVQGDVGSAADPIAIRAKFAVYQVVGDNVYADINTRVNGGSGGFWALLANRFIGSLSTEKFIFNQYNSLEGLIEIAQQFSGNITIGKSFDVAGQYIQVPANGLSGQIIVNADNIAGGAWSAPVRVGPPGDPNQIILTGPRYPQTSDQIGGGAVGLVPFRLHDQSCVPVNGATAQLAPTSPPLTVQLRHYGPVIWSGDPVTIERRAAGTTNAYSPAPLSDFAITAGVPSANVLQIGPAPGRPGFAAGYQYRIRPTTQLHCDVPAQPAVQWDADYLVTVVRPPCDGDINADGLVNINDMLLVISFWGPVAPIFPAPDINHDGMVNVNDLLIVIAHWGACW